MDCPPPSLIQRLVSDDPAVRLAALLDYTRGLMRVDSVSLTVRRNDGSGFDLVEQLGYPDEVMPLFLSDITVLREFAPQFRRPTRLFDWSEAPEFADSPSGAEVLRPAGYNNGFTMVLRTSTGALLGTCVGNGRSSQIAREAKAKLLELHDTLAGYAEAAVRVRELRLSTREREVLDLLVPGYANPKIAARLCISPRTVDTHVENILRKLGVPNRVSAASRAVQLGLTRSSWAEA